MNIDVADLIGKPFLARARGPNAYDCFGLTLEMLRRVGVYWDWPLALAFDEHDVPALHEIILEAIASNPWELIEDGPIATADVFIMGTGERWSHIVPMVSDKHCLHIAKTSTGVHLTSPQMLKRVGYRHQEAYRWRG